MITFVCCYNKENVLNELLLPSLDKIRNEGLFEFRTLLIDTRAKKYSSAAQAFNNEIKDLPQVNDDILVFLHQDISFDNSDAWLRIIDELKTDDRQIIGFAGMPKEIGRTVSNLKDRGNGKYLVRTQLKEKTEVESVDECCFAITRDWFDKIKFDESICYHWHLYAVNLSYQGRIDFGIKSFVIPEILYHKKTTSEGTIGGDLYTDTHFLRTLKKMIHKYKSNVPIIYTPCYICSTSFIGGNYKILKTRVKNLINSLKS